MRCAPRASQRCGGRALQGGDAGGDAGGRAGAARRMLRAAGCCAESIPMQGGARSRAVRVVCAIGEGRRRSGGMRVAAPFTQLFRGVALWRLASECVPPQRGARARPILAAAGAPARVCHRLRLSARVVRMTVWSGTAVRNTHPPRVPFPFDSARSAVCVANALCRALCCAWCSGASPGGQEGGPCGASGSGGRGGSRGRRHGGAGGGQQRDGLCGAQRDVPAARGRCCGGGAARRGVTADYG